MQNLPTGGPFFSSLRASLHAAEQLSVLSGHLNSGLKYRLLFDFPGCKFTIREQFFATQRGMPSNRALCLAHGARHGRFQ